jgi:hypothetical protein
VRRLRALLRRAWRPPVSLFPAELAFSPCCNVARGNALAFDPHQTSLSQKNNKGPEMTRDLILINPHDLPAFNVAPTPNTHQTARCRSFSAGGRWKPLKIKRLS